MRLTSASGEELELNIVGYQFPDADDLRLRFSWYMVAGSRCESQRQLVVSCDTAAATALRTDLTIIDVT